MKYRSVIFVSSLDPFLNNGFSKAILYFSGNIDNFMERYYTNLDLPKLEHHPILSMPAAFAGFHS